MKFTCILLKIFRILLKDKNMRDYSSDELNHLGCGLIEGTLFFHDFPSDLLDDPNLFIGNEAPAYLYVATWCFTKALVTTKKPEEIRNNLEKTHTLMADYNHKTPHIPPINPPEPRKSSRFSTSGHNPRFQYPTTSAPVMNLRNYR